MKLISRIKKGIKNPYLIYRHILHIMPPKIVVTLRIKRPMSTKDRFFLEKIIFKKLNSCSKMGDKLLFVGVASYTWHYDKLLKGFEFQTCDYDFDRAIYGSKTNHQVCSATDLSKNFPKNNFQIVVANGLFGFGLNTLEDFQVFMHESSLVLTRDGILILGYDESVSPYNIPLNIPKYFRAVQVLDPQILDSYNNINDHKFMFLSLNG